jgi:hypothetical protein
MKKWKDIKHKSPAVSNKALAVPALQEVRREIIKANRLDAEVVEKGRVCYKMGIDDNPEKDEAKRKLWDKGYADAKQKHWDMIRRWKDADRGSDHGRD